jgi:acetyltransferase-like isoleucine patch superfamily enzyme
VPHKLAWDWYAGSVPDNVALEPDAYLESSYSFLLYRSQAPVGVRIGRGSAVYLGCMFDLGPRAEVKIGACALLNGAWMISDAAIEIGDHALISWRVVFMDSYRVPHDPEQRRQVLRALAASGVRRLPGEGPARPIRVENNVWIGFDACILPGVTIGEGSIVGARAVVTDDVPPYSIAAGNPARVTRRLTPPEGKR